MEINKKIKEARLNAGLGGIFRDFCEAAIPWVLMGIGVACSTAYLSQKE